MPPPSVGLSQQAAPTATGPIPAAPTVAQSGERAQGQSRPDRNLVYISYSHKDMLWREKLRKILDSDPNIRDLVWDDTKIPGGSDWRREIQDHVTRARVMIMLGSPDYFAPDCGAAEYEIKPALEAHQKGEITILWFRVRDHSFSICPVRDIMAVTGPGAVPLETLSPPEQDAALRKIHQEVLNILGLAAKSPQTAIEAPASPVVARNSFALSFKAL